MLLVNDDPFYIYRANVVRVVDGDTVDVNIDLGLNQWTHKERLRLHRINAPETRGVEKQAGMISRIWLRNRVENKEIIIETFKDRKGKYGRYLANLWFDGVCINDEMVREGLAQYVDY